MPWEYDTVAADAELDTAGTAGRSSRIHAYAEINDTSVASRSRDEADTLPVDDPECADVAGTKDGSPGRGQQLYPGFAEREMAAAKYGSLDGSQRLYGMRGSSAEAASRTLSSASKCTYVSDVDKWACARPVHAGLGASLLFCRAHTCAGGHPGCLGSKRSTAVQCKRCSQGVPGIDVDAAGYAVAVLENPANGP